MPDGTRKRRYSLNPFRRAWYASHRARRFAKSLWAAAQSQTFLHGENSNDDKELVLVLVDGTVSRVGASGAIVAAETPTDSRLSVDVGK